MITFDQLPISSFEIIKNDLESEDVIYIISTSSNKGFKLDGIAARIILLIDNIKTIDEILNEICNEQKLNKDEIRNNTIELFEMLKTNELCTLKL